MKVEEIIEKLCNHEISKSDAIDKIKVITDGLRNNESLEFVVDEFGSTVENNHGYLNLILPYEYSKIKNKVSKGDRVDVSLLL
ncbi:MAG: hypothetical protein CL843_09160 [Crocinitomicaceae bacterium]|nr:hypothetical protein [Crocinitomicaceae bacterium]|tara:strand:+ start:6706 stop:6954 length:249 start_codon:yes stop_codon:yes gene_type:complete